MGFILLQSVLSVYMHERASCVERRALVHSDGHASTGVRPAGMFVSFMGPTLLPAGVKNLPISFVAGILVKTQFFMQDAD